MEQHIIVVDATLEHAERTPGCSLNLEERLRLAHQLERLSPDVIEAGAPMTSPLDFEAVRLIARSIEKCAVAARCRPRKTEIDRAWEALTPAKLPRLHISTDECEESDNPQETAERLAGLTEAVRYAATLCPDVQVSIANAPYMPMNQLRQCVSLLEAAGARTICLADAHGYATPDEYASMFRQLVPGTSSSGSTVLAAACANDLGLALANALAALRNGATQVECAVNGLGPRAGVVALEELTLLLMARPATVPTSVRLSAQEIAKTSRLVGSLTGMPPQKNRPVVGTNALAEQALPQGSPDAAVCPPYHQLTPAAIGVKQGTRLLGKHSDPDALAQRYREMGYNLTQDDLERAFGLFRQIAEQKRDVFDDDLLAILEQNVQDPEEVYHLENIQVHSGTKLRPTATIELRKGSDRFVDSATGDGPIDATLKAIERITGISGRLTEYLIKPMSVGRDGFGEVFVRLEFEGASFHGRGISTDVIIGSARAYLEALNRSIAARKKRAPGQ
jgi:2-isopropylmalate synthase